MLKKLKKIEKKKIIKLNNFELEEILKQKIKKNEIDKKEIKPKTKSLKEIKPIDVDAFQEFFYPRSKFTAPILNQIEQSQEIISLERGIENESSTRPENDTKENATNYQFNSSNYFSNSDEPKTPDKQYQPQIGPPVLRERFNQPPKTHLLSIGNGETNDQENMQPEFVTTEFTRAQRIKDNLPFEEENKKYEEFKP